MASLFPRIVNEQQNENLNAEVTREELKSVLQSVKGKINVQAWTGGQQKSTWAFINC